MMEFWLKPGTQIEDMKLGGITIKVEEGVVIRKVRAIGQRRRRLTLKGIPFSVSDREVLSLGECLGKVSEKGVRYVIGDENLVTMDRYMDIEVDKSLLIPPKVILGGRVVKVDYSGQNPSFGNCFRSKMECENGGFEPRCRERRERVNINQMSQQFYRAIGFTGEPELNGATEVIDDIIQKEIDNAMTNTERTPLKERCKEIHGAS